MYRIVALLIWFPVYLLAQPQSKTENGYTYTFMPNDPLNARIYTLKNGLKVYLTCYKDAPRIQTYIAVRAGSKHDPSHATGLAHYLEHILFKGTSKIGTTDWTKEQPLLQKIENLYEVYRMTKDPEERKKIYKKIDSLSVVASAYSIANEYDKLMNSIGAEGTNAYTFLEQTVYVNDIPSNQIDKWAEIEAERFSQVVPRLFHTELEAVYEEKNKGLDQDRRKVWETMMAALFQMHTYGTQTTIGTVEHLKNPSITEIIKYFNTYYVPNNMAICMSGDLDYNSTIKIIDKYFGKMTAKQVPPFSVVPEPVMNTPVVRNVYGPDAENITIAFRFGGLNSKGINTIGSVVNYDPYMIKMIAMLLSNGQAGLIDLNLNQSQSLIGGYAYDMTFNDYSVFAMGASPREGQTLEQVKDLLLAQLDSLKAGKFEEWLIKAVINDYRTSKMKEYESNRARADAFVDAFISNTDFAWMIEENTLASLNKKVIVDFVNQHFKNNYVVIYKRKGVDTTIQKVPKPPISPIMLNRDKESAFYKNITSKKVAPIQPVFIDYSKDLTIAPFKNNPDVLYKKNTENKLFSLSFVWDIGRETNPTYGIAADYFDYLGTYRYSPEQLKKEFYKLGCSYSVSASSDMISISLSGLHENMTASLILLEDLLNNARPNDEVLKKMISDILKKRADAKLNKDIILRSALVNYAKYGKLNPFTNILNKEALEKLTADKLISLIKDLKNMKHRVLYYGPEELNTLINVLETHHRKSNEFNSFPEIKKFPFADLKQSKVYFVHYDMVQAEIIMLSKSVPYNKDIVPLTALYNEYFGGSMGSLVFQEIREARALAYSVRSSYNNASKRDEPNYITSYIGTQADKIIEAIDAMNELLETFPKSDILFQTSKNSLIESISTTRITKAAVLRNYEAAQKLGLTYDIRKDIYNSVQSMTYDDIKNFHQTYIKNQPKTFLIVGSKDKIDLKALEKYATVTELQLDEIFGY
ncbi:MAG: insulinase family protein [Cytophagaceae bacterium]|nr:insulinase family protein [Cytophagaceae bacterium]MDW8456611.1 insulinase family protein [Cytophagaceae bacterium]